VARGGVDVASNVLAAGLTPIHAKASGQCTAAVAAALT